MIENAKQILKILECRRQTLGIAESCTGGSISRIFAQIPGASSVLRGAIVAYHVDIKTDLLRVDNTIIEKFGIVSRETAMAMSAGASKRLNTDWSVATTGFAGPGGGDAIHPVGTICIAVFGRTSLHYDISVCRHFQGNREQNIDGAAAASLELLLFAIKKHCELNPV